MTFYELNNIKVYLLGHASVMITSLKKTIYIDPFILPDNSPKADLILVTHEHFDHCAPDIITQISDNNTKIIAPEVCAISAWCLVDTCKDIVFPADLPRLRHLASLQN